MYTDNTPPAAPASTTSGRGFVFDPDGLNTALTDWQQLKADLEDDAAIAQRLVEVQGPGDEPASNGMAYKGQGSGNAFLDHNTSMQKFVQAYIDNLTNAQKEYLGRDGAGRDRFSSGGNQH